MDKQKRCQCVLLLSAVLTLVIGSPVLVSGDFRSGFPDGFLFGAGSSAYQYEGAAAEDGKGQSIWDVYTHRYPEKIADGSNGDVALDSYHRYKEDVDILREINLDAYKFSISWSRILPNGSLSGGINREGVKYYNNLINYLLSNGIQPFVVLFHWDTPQGLEDAYGSFLSTNIIADYLDYVRICFEEFGDRVKQWITFNEPYQFSANAYGLGNFAPGRCSPSVNNKCNGGDSGREPYIAAHNILLSHAAAVKLYREEYKVSQKGSIGITLNSHWYTPLSNSKSDFDATIRALDFSYGWFFNPLTYGEYPSTMIALVGNRLPKFTETEALLVKGSFDFVGVNYYTTKYVSSQQTSNPFDPTYFTDSNFITTAFKNGEPIGPSAASSWLYVYAPGLRELLLYTKAKYNNPTIYITENGVDEFNVENRILQEALNDSWRIDYIWQHLQYLSQAIREGVDVRGYFAWSLLDNLEWDMGFTVRFGLCYVDFQDGLKRYPKNSARWLANLLEQKRVSLRETTFARSYHVMYN